MKKIMIMMVAAMATVFSAVASSAASFVYQGVLRDGDGKVPASPVTIDFKLYESAEGGAAVWGRQMSVAIGANGLFKAELADANGSKTVSSEVKLADVIVNAETNQNVSLYIGVKVAGSADEIRPRQKLLTVPLAAYAQNLTGAKGDFKVGGELEVSGNIVSENGFVTAKGITTSGSSGSSFSAPVDFASGVTIGGTDSAKTNLVVNGPVVMKGNIDLGNNSKILLNGGYEGTLAIGTITLWSGASSALPPGWVVCAPRNGKTIKYKNPYDGATYSVPDLRGRFVVGANYNLENGVFERDTELSEYQPRAVGGKETIKLTTDEMPSHTHKIVFNENKVNFASADHHVLSEDNNPKDKRWRTTTSVGGDQVHENRPQFYALCYIIFIGDNEVE